MTSALVEKLSDVRDFRKILETTVKELGEHYEADVSQIVLSNPLDTNITSICEYLSNPDEPASTELPFTTFPLHLEGGGLGIVNISRGRELSESESNEIRITLSQITNLLRYAQINDIVQRDTFRSAFMSEIANLLTLPMGLGDALFMVVNILGKALNSNRCLFICTDDMQSGWKCYEYWQRDRLDSSQEYGWPSKDSAIVSQSLLSPVPLIVFEGQSQSYLTPVQEEMQFIGVRSLLAVPIRSSIGCHGSIIVQQCESRHAWTRDEVDMVQNAADTVAEMLAALPEEKKEMEPIMRLHQRDVAETKDAAQQNIQDIRKALKGALGQTAIPTARDTAAAKKAKEAALAPPPPPPQPIQEPTYSQQHQGWEQPTYAAQQGGQQWAAPGTPAYQQQSHDQQPEYQQQEYQQQEYQQPEYQQPEYQQPEYQQQEYQQYQQGYEQTPEGQPDNGGGWNQPEQPSAGMSGLADMLADEAGSVPPTPTGRSSLGGVLGGIFGNRNAGGGGGASAGAWDIETSQPQPPGPQARQLYDQAAADDQTEERRLLPADEQHPAVGGKWGNLDAIPAPANSAAEAPLAGPGRWGNLDAIPSPAQLGEQTAPQAQNQVSGNKWGNLDAIPSPATPPPIPSAKPPATGPGPAPGPGPVTAPATGGKWGNLDAIHAPGGNPAGTPGPRPVAGPAAQGPQAAAQQAQPTTLKGKWGDLDAIPAPDQAGGQAGGGGGRGGLGGAMMGKARASAVLGGAGLKEAFGKGGAKPAAYVEGPPVEVDEVAAEAKLKEVLNASDPTSDYIFATPGLDARLLGRIDGWVSQVESKDKYVGGHARPVAQYCEAIARILGLGPDETNQVRLAAIVHDIGKLALPGQVLMKPDEALTDAELVEVMKHPINGAKLLEGFPELSALAPAVLAHHEEFDGNGYPEGLAGEAIPLAARIIFVANAYHGMVCDLTYRQGMPPQQALQNLRTGSGITYDPNLVEALIAAISQGLVPARIE